MNRFTQKAQNTLNRALTEAREMGHTYIGSEHLLLGLLGESDSVAQKLLSKSGAEAEAVKSAVEEMVGRGSQTFVSAADMTPRTKKIIEGSAYESMRHGQNYIGT